MRCTVKCTPINCLIGPWPHLITGLPYHHPHPSGSQQFAYKYFGCPLMTTKVTVVQYKTVNADWVSVLQKCVMWLIVFCQTMVQLYDIWPMALLIELSSSPTNSVAHNESHGSQPQELVHDCVLCVCDDRKEMLCRLFFVILKWCLPLAILNIALYCSYQHSIKASSSFIKHLIMLTYLDDI